MLKADCGGLNLIALAQSAVDAAVESGAIRVEEVVSQLAECGSIIITIGLTTANGAQTLIDAIKAGTFNQVNDNGVLHDVFEAPCTEVRADVVFMVDTSPSTFNAGGADACDFKRQIRAFTSGLVRQLGDLVNEEHVRVAAVTFSNTAHTYFEFNSLGFEASRIADAM
jgi:hypothetical protein